MATSERTTEQQDAHAGAVIAELIEEQLAEERLRKSSLESRGLSIITTSSALVTLLLGIAALVTEREGFLVPSTAEPLVITALAGFTLAAIGGLYCNTPFRYAEAEVSDLARWIDSELWKQPAMPAELRASEARLAILENARRQNGLKAFALVIAIVAEVLAVGLLAAAVGVFLVEGG